MMMTLFVLGYVNHETVALFIVNIKSHESVQWDKSYGTHIKDKQQQRLSFFKTINLLGKVTHES